MGSVHLTKANMPQVDAAFRESRKPDKIFFDTVIKGFGLRCRIGGKRTWILQYKIHGAQRRLNLGPYPVIEPDEARVMAKREIGKVWNEKDPQAAKRAARARELITLGFVIEKYLAAKEPKLRKKSIVEVRRYLLRDWKPLHNSPMEKISQAQVMEHIDDLQRIGPVAAMHARSTLHSLFRWAAVRGYVTRNVVADTEKPKVASARKRVLSDDELARVWHASGDNDYGRVVRLLILTGCRREEVGGMCWQELNPDSRTWTLPAARTKNKQDHELPLPGMAWSIIETVKQRPGREHLFGRRGIKAWAQGKTALDKRAPLAKPWVLHDLRRAVATRMADIGVQPHIIEAVLNHISGHKAGVAGIYNRSTYERDKRAALAMWADHVRSIVEGTEPTVVPIRKGIAAIPA